MHTIEDPVRTITLADLESVNGGLAGETWADFGERYGRGFGGPTELGKEAGGYLGRKIGGWFDK